MVDPKNNLIIVFTPKAEEVFENMIQKYQWEEDEERAIKKAIQGKLETSSIVKKAIRTFVADIISEEDFITSLKKILRIDQQAAQDIKKDIAENLIPLLDKVPEEKLEAYNEQQELEPQKTSQKEPLKVRRVVPAATKPSNSESDQYRETIE